MISLTGYGRQPEIGLSWVKTAAAAVVRHLGTSRAVSVGPDARLFPNSLCCRLLQTTLGRGLPQMQRCAAWLAQTTPVLRLSMTS